LSKQLLVREFVRTLQSDVQRITELAHMLERQYEMMSRRETHLLEQHNKELLTSMQTIINNNADREQLLEKLGLPGDKRGIDIMLQHFPPSLRSNIAALLKELALRSQLCQALNEKCGRLLASQRQLMQRLTGLRDSSHYPDLQF
jgi:flagellar biosynthesis protein FlgN